MNSPYPKIHNGASGYVKIPVQMTENLIQRFKEGGLPCGNLLLPGQWAPIELLERGWLIHPAQMPSESRETCEKYCRMHNKIHGYSDEDVRDITWLSAGYPILHTEDGKKKYLPMAIFVPN